MTGLDDRSRREARATFGRAVAHIQDCVDSWNKAMPNGPEQPAALSMELVTEFAILATIGPPLAEHETSDLDDNETEIEDFEPDPEQAVAMLRQSMPMMLAMEVISAAAIAYEANPEGWSSDREGRACQLAVHLTKEDEDRRGKPFNAVQEYHTIASHYLGNHDDGYWLLLGTEADLHDLNEDDDDDTNNTEENGA